MISGSFDISEFIAEVKGHSHQEIIFLADAEATAAERESYKKHLPKDLTRMRNYAMGIKDVILYMRHGILTRTTRALDLRGLEEDRPN
jgi:hypothetical protein